MNPALHFHENINIYLCVKSCADILALKITVKVNSLYSLLQCQKGNWGQLFWANAACVIEVDQSKVQCN